MPQVIQKTKLFIPPVLARSVERPRLLTRLVGLPAGSSRVAVFSAPAGFGKTTLIVQWLARQITLAGWLSLNERDNLSARFFSYLIAALQEIVPDTGREARSLLELPGASVEEIITLLANDLMDVPGPFILVLDNLFE
jgi:LuxR family maltose regulon positive regulatory protein